MRAKRRLASRALALGVVVALGAGACAGALRQPTPQDAQSASGRWPATSLEDLARGRSLYVRRCSSCHTLYLPAAHQAEAWPALVESMSEKARLSAAQQRDITRFVVTLAAVPRPSPSQGRK